MKTIPVEIIYRGSPETIDNICNSKAIRRGLYFNEKIVGAYSDMTLNEKTNVLHIRCFIRVDMLSLAKEIILNDINNREKILKGEYQ